MRSLKFELVTHKLRATEIFSLTKRRMRRTSKRLSMRKPSWVSENATSFNELNTWEKRSESNTFAQTACVERTQDT